MYTLVLREYTDQLLDCLVLACCPRYGSPTSEVTWSPTGTTFIVGNKLSVYSRKRVHQQLDDLGLLAAVKDDHRRCCDTVCPRSEGDSLMREKPWL